MLVGVVMLGVVGWCWLWSGDVGWCGDVGCAVVMLSGVMLGVVG